MFLLPDDKATFWTACAKAYSQKEIASLFEKSIFLLYLVIQFRSFVSR